LRTHPQETGEGSVDLGHLRAVHLYDDVEELVPPLTEGHTLSASYRARRPALSGMQRSSFSLEFSPTLHGLGFSTVRVRLPDFGLEYRLWVLATPIDPDHIDYRVAFSLRDPMWKLPRGLVLSAIEAATYRGFVHDVALDFPIWETKAYVPRPRLCTGDGPIARYRRWAAQFYA
jgi:hypothetical protein